MPESAVERAASLAQARGLDGWLITLDAPSVQAVLKHAENRDLRRELHTAYLDRCTGGDHDNHGIVEQTLALRREMAELLGFGAFPDYRLELLMAGSGRKVRGFLDDLAERTRPFWDRDLTALRAKAERMGLGVLEPWDVSFVSEALKRERFDLDDEALRPWFPLPEVESGLFELARRLFGLSIERVENDAVWHPDVRLSRDP